MNPILFCLSFFLQVVFFGMVLLGFVFGGTTNKINNSQCNAALAWTLGGFLQTLPFLRLKKQKTPHLGR